MGSVMFVIRSTTYLFTALFLALLLTSKAPAAPVLDPNRTVTISGVIANGNVLQLAPALYKMAEDTSKPIDIVINSPGGDVITGFMFINVMEELKAKGATLRCFVPTMAASMAFQIFVHCSERHALDRALLLWHRVRVIIGGGGIFGGGGVAVTAPMALELAKDLQENDDLILQELVESLNEDMAADQIEYHFNRETLHVGEQLGKKVPGFLTSHKAIPGLVQSLMNQKPGRSSVEDRVQFKPGTIIYIYQK